MIQGTTSAYPTSIIMADDDLDDRELFSDVLKEIDCNVQLDFAEDGEHLMRKLYNESIVPDLVFLDLNMPNKGGRECLDLIRSNQKLKDLIVIIFSTSNSPVDIKETYDKGANLYVSKPGSFYQLIEMIKKVLTDRQAYKPYSSKSNYVFKFETNEAYL
ncbi:MAG: response regulator [Bacteroidota bacterium]